MYVLIYNFGGIIVVFLSNLEYNAKPPFSSHVLYWFLHTWLLSLGWKLNNKTSNNKNNQQNIQSMNILLAHARNTPLQY